MARESGDPRRACTDLIAAFAYYIDHRQYDNAIELFADHAVFDRPDGKRHGKNNIAKLWENRPDNQITRHLFCTPFFLSITPESAESITQCTLYQVFHEGDGTPKIDAPLGVAEYRDLFIKTQAGWKFIDKTVKPIILFS